MSKHLSFPRLLLSGMLLLLNWTATQGTHCMAQDKSAATPPNTSDTAPQSPEPPMYSLSVHTQIVLLDVAVNDAKGQAVHGLKREDFTILEDGVPQKIVMFDAVTPSPEAKTVPIHSTTELDRLEPDLPVSIIVLDELTTKFEDEYFARYSLEKYLGKQGEVLDQPMMLIARTQNRTNVLHDYTTSKREILEALKRHLVGNDWAHNNASFSDLQTGATFASLIEVARATQGHPGHKNLIWIGRGFPAISFQNVPQDQIDGMKGVIASCVDILRNARITLYSLDPAGVTGPDQTMDQTGNIVMNDPFGDQVSFDTMVTATGGQSLHGRNDVDNQIETAVNNGEIFYTVAYRGSSPTSEDPKQFRKIQVVLNDKTLTATTRQGYYPVPPEVTSLKDDAGKLSPRANLDLSSATSGLMVFDGVLLGIARDSAAPDQFHISFPARTIGLAERDGKFVGDVTLIVVSYDKAGKVLDKSGKVVSLHLAALKEGETESRTIQIATTINTKSPAARVRFVLRANGNGKIGADNFFLVNRNTLKDPATGVKPSSAR